MRLERLQDWKVFGLANNSFYYKRRTSRFLRLTTSQILNYAHQSSFERRKANRRSTHPSPKIFGGFCNKETTICILINPTSNVISNIYPFSKKLDIYLAFVVSGLNKTHLRLHPRDPMTVVKNTHTEENRDRNKKVKRLLN